MTKVLVTGASGQLGMAIRAASGDYPIMDLVFKSHKQLDITDTSQLVRLWEKNSFDYCINCAAFTDVERAEKEPDLAYRINAEGVKNLAEICQHNSCILIHISTDYVFDGQKHGGYLPSDTPNPINEYGKSKLLGERYVQDILKKFFIIRTSWLYSEYGNNFYTKIIEKARKGDTLYVTNTEIGCPTHADNLAKYTLKQIREGNKSYGIYHFTDGIVMTWYEFAGSILLKEGFQEKVSLKIGGNYRIFAKRPTNSVLLNTLNH
jgi:dTDP-4-dehydrorhamnose reductase